MTMTMTDLVALLPLIVLAANWPVADARSCRWSSTGWAVSSTGWG